MDPTNVESIHDESILMNSDEGGQGLTGCLVVPTVKTMSPVVAVRDEDTIGMIEGIPGVTNPDIEDTDMAGKTSR